jgi:hypothetical protein
VISDRRQTSVHGKRQNAGDRQSRIHAPTALNAPIDFAQKDIGIWYPRFAFFLSTQGASVRAFRAFRASCSVPDGHIGPRRSAFFMARSVLRECGGAENSPADCFSRQTGRGATMLIHLHKQATYHCPPGDCAAICRISVQVRRQIGGDHTRQGSLTTKRGTIHPPPPRRLARSTWWLPSCNESWEIHKTKGDAEGAGGNPG